MRILVTGGAGFIGSHLVEKLREEGHEVTILDRKHKPGPYSKSYIELDCREFDDACRKPNGTSCGHDYWDFCYHLASTVGVSNVLADPSECIDNIVNSTRSILSLGIPGIYFSTSEVYGKADSGTSGEDGDIRLSRKARWAYAASKMCGEWMALQAGWKVVRPFNVVGPRQNTAYGAVLPTFVRQAIHGEPITVYGDGNQLRTFIDVSDFVEIIVKLGGHAASPAPEFDVVNVGGTHIFSIKDLATFVKFWFKSDSEIVYKPYSEAYPEGFEECQSRIPSWKKLESLIGKQQYRRFGETLDSIAADLKEKQNVRFETEEPVL